jgi:hypothetical protein
VFGFNFVLKAHYILDHNQDVNLISQFDIIDIGTSCILITLFTYIQASLFTGSIIVFWQKQSKFSQIFFW